MEAAEQHMKDTVIPDDNMPCDMFGLFCLDSAWILQKVKVIVMSQLIFKPVGLALYVWICCIVWCANI